MPDDKIPTCNWCSNTECDCVDRIQCASVGEAGHRGCGWCHVHAGPRWECLDLCAHWHPATISRSVQRGSEVVWTATLSDREGRVVAWRTGATPHQAWIGLQSTNAKIRAGDHVTKLRLSQLNRFRADAP